MWEQNYVLKGALKSLGYGADFFVNKLEYFKRQYKDYKEEEIKKLIETVKDFKDMFCCDNPSAANNVNEERVIVPSNTEGTQRDDNKIAELKNLLAEREKELKEQKAKTEEHEKQLKESTTSHQTDHNNFQQERSKMQLYIKELKESLNEQGIKAKQISEEVKKLEVRATSASDNEEAKRKNKEIAEYEKMLADKEKELDEERKSRAAKEKQILESYRHELHKMNLHIEHLYNSLNEQNIRAQQLSDEIKKLQIRNSRLLSSQEEGGVQFKDKYLPGKIASMCKTLFREHYTDARHFLKEKDCTDDKIYYFLGEVLWGAIEMTKKAVKEGQMAAKEATLEALSLKHCDKNDDKDLPKQMEKEIFRRLRQYPSREEQKYITEKIMESYQDADGSNNSFRRYVEECVRVTWLMNASSPPMYASFDDHNVSSEKHEVRHGTGDVIKHWIIPCIYFSKEAYHNHEDVLVMGVVVTH